MPKHKTSEELTGLTSEETKELNIISNLIDWHMTNQNNDTGETYIQRYNLRIYVIGKAFNKALNEKTVSTYINMCIAKDYLIQNPTSHIIVSKKFFNTPHILPTNDTRYKINIDLIRKVGQKLKDKQKRENLVGVSPLDTYLNKEK